MRNLISVILLLLFLLPIGARNSNVYNDSLFFENHVSDFKEYQSLPMGDLMIKAVSFFKGTPYVASTLDKGKKEELVVNLNEFDCTTLVETSLALTGTIKSEIYTLDTFKRLLQMIRYREEAVNDYSSRLHYVSDWVFDNCEKGIITDITQELGGILETKKINFMTTHPESYAQLKNDKEMLLKMQKAEADINDRGGYYYIPKKDIPTIENQIKDGDIIAFATSIKGLDYSHMGIAYWDKGKLTFIHASTRTKDVTVESKSLYEYCSKSTNCTGITVLRIKE